MSVGKLFFQFFIKHKFKSILLLLSIILFAVIALLPAQVLRVIVDEIIPLGDERKLLLIACVYIVTYILVGLTTFLKEVILLSFSQQFMKKLRSTMMKHIGNLNYTVLVNTDSGSLEAYFNNDVNALNELFTSGVISMITDFLKMAGIFVSIFIYSHIFGLIVLCLMPVLLIITLLVRKGMLKAQLKTKSLEGNANKQLLEMIENVEQIKVNKADNYAVKKYETILKNHFKASQSSNFYDAFFSPLMQLIRSGLICSILLLSGWNPNLFGMSIGMIISSISLLTDLFSPIENLGMELQTIQKSIAALKRINSFFAMETDEVKQDSEIHDFTLTFDKVSFGYTEQDVIKNFSLTISKGEKIVLQGPSGAGKSTLMKLAMGMLKPRSGEVKIGNESVYLVNSQNRQSLFSIVYQDPFFSGDSIFNELTLRNSAISKFQVRDVLDSVGLNYITDLDQILNPSLYSSGELALFNIARMMIQDTPIIFLDEMNSKLDPASSKQIISLVNQYAKDKTVISISHYGSMLEGSKIIHIGAGGNV